MLGLQNRNQFTRSGGNYALAPMADRAGAREVSPPGTPPPGGSRHDHNMPANPKAQRTFLQSGKSFIISAVIEESCRATLASCIAPRE